MWNGGIPYTVKHYIDVIHQPGMLWGLKPDTGYFGLPKDKHVTLVLTAGAYSPSAPSPAFGMDHHSSYLRDWLNQAGVAAMDEVRFEPTLLTSDPTGDFERAKGEAIALAGVHGRLDVSLRWGPPSAPESAKTADEVSKGDYAEQADYSEGALRHCERGIAEFFVGGIRVLTGFFKPRSSRQYMRTSSVWMETHRLTCAYTEGRRRRSTSTPASTTRYGKGYWTRTAAARQLVKISPRKGCKKERPFQTTLSVGPCSELSRKRCRITHPRASPNTLERFGSAQRIR